MAKNKIDIHNIDLLSLATMIAKKYVYGFKEGFKEGGGMTDDSEMGWKPSKKTYKNPALKTLVDTGLLRKSIKAVSVTKDEVVIKVVGKAAEYGGKHNFGKEGMPMREFIGKSERINHRVLRWMKSEIKRQILNKR
jgi:phage gpG-like protein